MRDETAPLIPTSDTERAFGIAADEPAVEQARPSFLDRLKKLHLVASVIDYRALKTKQRQNERDIDAHHNYLVYETSVLDPVQPPKPPIEAYATRGYRRKARAGTWFNVLTGQSLPSEAAADRVAIKAKPMDLGARDRRAMGIQPEMDKLHEKRPVSQPFILKDHFLPDHKKARAKKAREDKKRSS